VPPADDVPVAVITGRSEWAIIAMLGIWRAGHVYTPLAQGAPDDHLRRMLGHVRPGAILTDAANAARVKDVWGGCPVVTLEEPVVTLEEPVVTLEDPVVTLEEQAQADEKDDQLACLVHTSGSSGPAKGTMVTHGALSNLIINITTSYAPGPDDVALHFGTFGWDSSIEEAILPLHSGSALVIRTDEADFGVPHFLRALRENAVSHLYLPTSYWHEICVELARGEVEFPASIRGVLVGGERAQTADLAIWRKAVQASVQFVNCYGLTETCITSTLYHDDRNVPLEQFSGVPLGTACPTVTTVILDDEMEPLPPGAAGELFIGGPGVARGYWRDPAATAAAFVPDPSGNGRLYRTGDLVRQDESGLLHFVGRADRQIKISGFRVNPGEIEAVIADHPDVRKASVLPRQEPSGHIGMVAYLELADGGSAAVVQAHLESRLQGFMVPAVFEVLPQLPLLPSGKVDVDQLRGRKAAKPGPAATHGPADDVEQIWCEALGIASCRPTDDFLSLGGNSLSGMRIAARINERFDAGVRFRDVLDSRTLAALTDRVAELTGRA
jgi:amino acid adenylation domain-containing protein